MPRGGPVQMRRRRWGAPGGGPLRALPPVLPEPLGDELGFRVRVRRLQEAHLQPFFLLTPQHLALAGAVVLDDGGGGVEDGLGGAVVLLEENQARPGEVLLEAEDVAVVGPAPAVDGLVFVAHHAEVRLLACIGLAGQPAQELVLRAVGVLVFVTQTDAEALLPAPARPRGA